MAAPGSAYLVYTLAGEAVTLDLAGEHGRFSLAWLDSATGELVRAGETIAAGQTVRLVPPPATGPRPWVAWLTRP
jgi:hypothetical protein